MAEDDGAAEDGAKESEEAADEEALDTPPSLADEPGDVPEEAAPSEEDGANKEDPPCKDEDGMVAPLESIPPDAVELDTSPLPLAEAPISDEDPREREEDAPITLALDEDVPCKEDPDHDAALVSPAKELDAPTTSTPPPHQPATHGTPLRQSAELWHAHAPPVAGSGAGQPVRSSNHPATLAPTARFPALDMASMLLASPPLVNAQRHRGQGREDQPGCESHACRDWEHPRAWDRSAAALRMEATGHA